MWVVRAVMVNIAGLSVTPAAGDGFVVCIYSLYNSGVDFGSERSGEGLIGTIICLSSAAIFLD